VSRKPLCRKTKQKRIAALARGLSRLAVSQGPSIPNKGASDTRRSEANTKLQGERIILPGIRKHNERAQNLKRLGATEARGSSSSSSGASRNGIAVEVRVGSLQAETLFADGGAAWGHFLFLKRKKRKVSGWLPLFVFDPASFWFQA
jgi:hypothetical protein